MSKQLTNETIHTLRDRYRAANKRLFCLDYDGTLVDLAPTPDESFSTPELLVVLRTLLADPKNTVAIITGRNQPSIERLVGAVPGLALSAEHGCFARLPGGEWQMFGTPDPERIAVIKKIMQQAVRAVPHSFIEEKKYSLAWHHRLSPAAEAKAAVAELTAALTVLGVKVLIGSKVVEARVTAVNKGVAVNYFVDTFEPDFTFITGDDLTDETMFAVAPPQAITVKVRQGDTAAEWCVQTPQELLGVLRVISADSGGQ